MAFLKRSLFTLLAALGLLLVRSLAEPYVIDEEKLSVSLSDLPNA